MKEAIIKEISKSKVWLLKEIDMAGDLRNLALISFPKKLIKVFL